MKSSGNSSETATPPPPVAPSATPPRKAFALTGRSIVLDPVTHAVRTDLADVRLADQVFAPHYAAPMPRRVATTAELRTERDPASAVLVVLEASETFEVLDLIGDAAWGIAPAHTLVGYLPIASLAPLTPGASS